MDDIEHARVVGIVGGAESAFSIICVRNLHSILSSQEWFSAFRKCHRFPHVFRS